MYRKYNQLGDDKQEDVPVSYRVIEIQNHEHKQDLIRKNAILCIDVHANWCQPCKQIEPAYAVLSKQMSIPGKCMLVKENIDSGLSKDFEITAVPIFLIFYRGALYKRISGADLSPVENTLQELLNEFSNKYVEQPHPPIDSGFSNNNQSRNYHQQQTHSNQPQQSSRPFPQQQTYSNPLQQPAHPSEQIRAYQGQPTANYMKNYGSKCNYAMDSGSEKTQSPAFNSGNSSVRHFNKRNL